MGRVERLATLLIWVALLAERCCIFHGPLPEWAFWTANVGMIGMTGAFAVAGIAQVYMERRIGMDFLAVQEAVEVHFGGVVLPALLLTFGIALFIWNFIQYGLPNDEALERG